MKVTYIDHSGFYVELEHCALLFDYSKGKLPAMDLRKPLYVFISHHHSDHFSPMLFPRLRGIPNITYILSEDIARQCSRSTLGCLGMTDAEYECIHFVQANKHYTFDDLELGTLCSTDEGVAFLVRAEGQLIYHAGDLNLWKWPGDPEELNRHMEEQFKRILRPLKGRHFDAAFLPLDPRQGEWFALGFDYFMRHTDTDIAYPMHFWGQGEAVERLLELECSTPYRERIGRAEQVNRKVRVFA